LPKLPRDAIAARLRVEVTMTKRPEAPNQKSPPPTRTEVEAEVPGTKSTEPKTDEERRAEYERNRRGLKPDEEPC
jgi:hypothetical protein